MYCLYSAHNGALLSEKKVFCLLACTLPFMNSVKAELGGKVQYVSFSLSIEQHGASLVFCSGLVWPKFWAHEQMLLKGLQTLCGYVCHIDFKFELFQVGEKITCIVLYCIAKVNCTCGCSVNDGFKHWAARMCYDAWRASTVKGTGADRSPL